MQWIRRVASWAWRFVGAASIVIGVAGIPDDFAQWATWLQPLDTETGRWVSGLIGVFVLANAVDLVGAVRALVYPGQPVPVPTSPRRATPIQASSRAARLQLKHDDVLWEDSGGAYVLGGGLIASGPFCPNDQATLRFLPAPSTHLVSRESNDVSNHWDDTVSQRGAKLVCPECKAEYTLGEESKKVKTARQEAEARLEGLRKRRAATP